MTVTCRNCTGSLGRSPGMLSACSHGSMDSIWRARQLPPIAPLLRRQVELFVVPCASCVARVCVAVFVAAPLRIRQLEPPGTTRSTYGSGRRQRADHSLPLPSEGMESYAQ